MPYEFLKTLFFLRWVNLKESFCSARDSNVYTEHLFQPKKLQAKTMPPIYGVFCQKNPCMRICALKKEKADSLKSAKRETQNPGTQFKDSKY